MQANACYKQANGSFPGPAIKGANKDAMRYVERSTTVHSLFFMQELRNRIGSIS